MKSETDLHLLHDKSVLVRFRDTKPHFPVALRGSLAVIDSETPGQPPVVELVLNFPDMFNESAYQRVIRLTDDDVTRLLASERDGAFEFTLERKPE